MSDPVVAPAGDPSKPGKKRNQTQRDADSLFIERLSMRGVGLMAIQAALNKERNGLYSLSHVQVHKDLQKLRDGWRRESLQLLSDQRTRELRKIDKIEEEVWDAWDRSKRDEIDRTMGKIEDDLEEGSKRAKSPARKHDSVKKRQRDGDVQFIQMLIQLSDRRVKLLGLAAADRVELSGPGGGPIATSTSLDDEVQDAIFRRHMDRMKKADRIDDARLAILPPDGSSPDPAAPDSA